MLDLLGGHTSEILLDVGFHSDSKLIGELALTIDNNIYLRSNRSPSRALHHIQKDLDLSGLAWFDLRESSRSTEVIGINLRNDIHSDRLRAEVGILDAARLGVALLLVENTVVPRFLLEVECAHLNRVFLGRVGRLRNHFAFDVESNGRYSSVASNRNSLLETTRTTIRVVGNGDLSGSTWLDRFACPLRSGATATSLNIR